MSRTKNHSCSCWLCQGDKDSPKPSDRRRMQSADDQDEVEQPCSCFLCKAWGVGWDEEEIKDD